MIEGNTREEGLSLCLPQALSGMGLSKAAPTDDRQYRGADRQNVAPLAQPRYFVSTAKIFLHAPCHGVDCGQAQGDSAGRLCGWAALSGPRCRLQQKLRESSALGQGEAQPTA